MQSCSKFIDICSFQSSNRWHYTKAKSALNFTEVIHFSAGHYVVLQIFNERGLANLKKQLI